MLKNPKIRMGLVGLVIVVVGYLFVLPRFQASSAPPEIPEYPNPGPTYTLAPKVYNLLTPSAQAPRYLKLGVVFEFATEDAAFFQLTGAALKVALEHFAEELGPKRPLIEDLVGTIVSRRTLEDVSNALGRDTLKSEVMEAVAQVVGAPLLLNIYFTEFVYQ